MGKIRVYSNGVNIREIWISADYSLIEIGLFNAGTLLTINITTGKVELKSPNSALFQIFLEKLLGNNFDYRDFAYISKKYWLTCRPCKSFFLNPRRFIGLFLEEIVDELQSKVAKYNAQK